MERSEISLVDQNHLGAFTLDRLDAGPLVARGESRAKVAPGLVAVWAGAPRLAQDHAPAQDAGAGAHALGSHGCFHRGDLRAQLGAELLRVTGEDPDQG